MANIIFTSTRKSGNTSNIATFTFISGINGIILGTGNFLIPPAHQWLASEKSCPFSASAIELLWTSQSGESSGYRWQNSWLHPNILRPHQILTSSGIRSLSSPITVCSKLGKSYYIIASSFRPISLSVSGKRGPFCYSVLVQWKINTVLVWWNLVTVPWVTWFGKSITSSKWKHIQNVPY